MKTLPDPKLMNKQGRRNMTVQFLYSSSNEFNFDRRGKTRHDGFHVVGGIPT